MAASNKQAGTDLTGVEVKLDQLISLLGYQVTQGKTLTEAAPVLKRLGLTNAQIAGIFDSTPHTVAVRLSEAAKKVKASARPARDGAASAPSTNGTGE
jgi:DNA-binding CsgD family transcriptional regulator